MRRAGFRPPPIPKPRYELEGPAARATRFGAWDKQIGIAGLPAVWQTVLKNENRAGVSPAGVSGLAAEQELPYNPISRSH